MPDGRKGGAAAGRGGGFCSGARKTRELYGQGIGSAVREIPCGGKARCHGQHGQLLPQRGQAVCGGVGVCRSVGGKQEGGRGFCGVR